MQKIVWLIYASVSNSNLQSLKKSADTKESGGRTLVHQVFRMSSDTRCSLATPVHQVLCGDVVELVPGLGQNIMRGIQTMSILLWVFFLKAFLDPNEMFLLGSLSVPELCRPMEGGQGHQGEAEVSLWDKGELEWRVARYCPSYWWSY